MTYLLFLDESGQDHGKSPYEVRSVAAVHHSRLWDLTVALREAELRQFGVRYTGPRHELKAKALLKRKTYRLASQMPPFAADERSYLARQALAEPTRISRRSLAALGQAKVAFCCEALELCAAHEVAFFAAIVHPTARVSSRLGLRRDYIALFQRLACYLESRDASEHGILVMDEIDRSDAHMLMPRMTTYFRHTSFGRAQRHRLVPAPIFVPSDLSAGVQVADIVAYVVSWNVRLPSMNRDARSELDTLGDLVSAHYRQYGGLWSFVYLDDLRTDYERAVETLPALAAAGVSPN